MTADSVLEAIEANTVARILTVDGVLASKACASAELFKPMEQPDGSVVRTATMPDDFPGTVTSVVDDEVEPWEQPNQYEGSAQFGYRLPVLVAVYATSDGSVAGEARKRAWKTAEAIQRDLVLFVPNGPTLAPEGSTIYPLEPAEFETILADETTYGLLLKFWAKYVIGVVS